MKVFVAMYAVLVASQAAQPLPNFQTCTLDSCQFKMTSLDALTVLRVEESLKIQLDSENKTSYLDALWPELKKSQCDGNSGAQVKSQASSAAYNHPVDNLFLMQSPNQPFIITTTYLFLVLKLGPFFMAQKQRFHLTATIRIYNVLQILSNIILLGMGLKVLPNFNLWHDPSDPGDSETVDNVIRLNHLFLMLKIFDLVETIFFVLRKKTEQVSFLHVFHHVGLVWITWVSCKYFRGIYGFLPAAFNTFVHTFMYVYYLQSSRGKVMNKLWKKCLTSMQIGHQLVIFVLYLALLVHTKCPQSRLYLSVTLGYMIVIIYLFFKFYKDSYTNKKASKEQ